MQYLSLENTPLNVICHIFNEAFSDYQVKMNISLTQFEKMLKRRGYNASLSIGAFENGKLVGFVLNGLRDWNGKKTIYDLGTGVIPAYRKKGITSTILKTMQHVCNENHIESYLLEVIQENINALSLYQKQGFTITRNFNCFEVSVNDLNLKMNNDIEIEIMDYFDEKKWNQVCEFWDYSPSWQNSIDSINELSNDFQYIVAKMDDKVIGYGVFEKEKGSIVQIAVTKECRRKNVASTILQTYISNNDVTSLTIVNVDDRNKSLCHYLEYLGFTISVTQYEMIKYFINS